MKFEVIYAEQALNDLLGIRHYIATELLAPETARRWSERIMAAIEGLNEMPNRHPLVGKDPWRSRGLRKLVVNHFVVFYLPMEKRRQVLILTILFGKRDLTKILSSMETKP